MGRGRKSRRQQAQTGAEAISIAATPKIFPTAIYVRLSVENLGREDRGAIENQKDVCREYVSECPDLQLVRIYEDNGWTGTIMHRPAFDELMDDIKNGIEDHILDKAEGYAFLECNRYGIRGSIKNIALKLKEKENKQLDSIHIVG